MTTPWQTCTFTGTWVDETGAMLEGRYRIKTSVRTADQAVGGIIPEGSMTDDLATVPGSPSLSVEVPATDDPDLSPAGRKVTIVVSFAAHRAPESYTLDAPAGQTIDLSSVILPQTVPTQAPFLVRGEPGGVAGLNGDGDVIDAAGNPVTGGTGGTAATWGTLAGKPDTFPPTIGTTADTALAGDTVIPAAPDLSGYALTADVPTTAADIGAAPASALVVEGTTDRFVAVAGADGSMKDSGWKADDFATTGALTDGLAGKLDTSEVSAALTGATDASVVRRNAGRIKAETGVDGDDVVNLSQLTPYAKTADLPSTVTVTDNGDGTLTLTY